MKMEVFLDYNMPTHVLDHYCELSSEEEAFVVRVVVADMDDEEVQDIVRSIIDFSSLSLFDPEQRDRLVVIKVFEERYGLEEPLQIITMMLVSENIIKV